MGDPFQQAVRRSRAAGSGDLALRHSSELPYSVRATTKPFSVRDAGRGERISLLSPHSSPLSPRFWAVGPIRPSLVRGLRPRNAPSPTTSRRSECVGNSTLATRGDQNFPRIMTRPEYVPAQARQARQLPYIPNVHRDDHRQPATELPTVHSAQAVRTQYTHRTWPGSYQFSTISFLFFLELPDSLSMSHSGTCPDSENCLSNRPRSGSECPETGPFGRDYPC